jgi:hypothetical protein
VTEQDVLHATRNIIRVIEEQPGNRTLYIAADSTARFLEIVIKDDDGDGEPEVIHAMPLRKNFHRYL